MMSDIMLNRVLTVARLSDSGELQQDGLVFGLGLRGLDGWAGGWIM